MVLVEARCRKSCRKVVGQVVEFDGQLLWEATEFDIDNASTSKRGAQRARRIAVAIDGSSPDQRRPTDDCDLASAPDVVRGWCPDDGAPPFERDELLELAAAARRDHQMRSVVVQRW
jgi:hypothetical protein